LNNSKDNNQIDEIKRFVTKHKIRVQKNTKILIASPLVPVDLSIGASQYTVQINDEYNDLACNNHLLHVILVFRELALLSDATDFLQWCTQNDCDASNPQMLTYYKDLCNRMEEITSYFPSNEINYFITDLDFQLNAGVIHFLRK